MNRLGLGIDNPVFRDARRAYYRRFVTSATSSAIESNDIGSRSPDLTPGVRQERMNGREEALAESADGI